MSADQRRRSAAGRLYGVLLVAYPAAFRARFERDMRETFVADCRRARERGSRAYVAFWARTAVEAVRYGVAERIGSRGSERAAHPDGGATMPSRLAVDLRDACRALRTTPVVVAAAVLSLALGIGANTALFSIFNSLVLKALPVRDPEQLVIIPHGSWTNPIWEQIRDREERIGAGAFAFSVERFDLSPQGQTDLVDGAFASGGMFQVLGLTPARGRLLTPADDVRGGGPTGGVAVVSYGLWQRRLGGGEDVVGRTITIDRVPFTIVGVMPPAFSGPVVGRALDLVVPIGDEPLIRGTGTVLDARSTWWLEIMLRLRPGQTIAQATAALRAAQPQIRAATIPSNFGPEMEARYLTEPFLLEPASTGPSELRGQFGQPLMALIVVVGAVLLIACANIANLLLARAAARRRDLTVRLALGASRLRIARQLFCESLILAGAGTVLGLLLARAGSRLLVQQFSSAAGTVTLDTPLDLHVLAFTAAIGALTALIFGVAPALGARHMAAYEALKDQSRTIAGDRRLGLRNVLVVSQVALSLALVVTAGLFIRTFQSLSAVPLGLRVDPLLTVTLDVKRSPAEGAARLQLFERLRDVATSTPGVKAAAILENRAAERRGLERVRRPAGRGQQLPGGAASVGQRRHAGMVPDLRRPRAGRARLRRRRSPGPPARRDRESGVRAALPRRPESDRPAGLDGRPEPSGRLRGRRARRRQRVPIAARRAAGHDIRAVRANRPAGAGGGARGGSDQPGRLGGRGEPAEPGARPRRCRRRVLVPSVR